MIETFDVKKSCDAQAALCKEKGYPHFAPKNGVCWCCNRNIYQPQSYKVENGRSISVPHDSQEAKFTSGVSVEKASTSLITGCPHCSRTYCD